jgi:hypothetical protein
MRKRIERALVDYNLQSWAEYPRFLQYLISLPDFLCGSDDFVQAYYDYQMEDFDYHMWSFDFCHMTHVASYGSIFIYTYEGKFLREQYSEEAINLALKLFGTHTL